MNCLVLRKDCFVILLILMNSLILIGGRLHIVNAVSHWVFGTEKDNAIVQIADGIMFIGFICMAGDFVFGDSQKNKPRKLQ